jgi:hypothetical protein
MWLCKSKTGATSRINLEWAQFKTTSKASQSALACMWMEQGLRPCHLWNVLGQCMMKSCSITVNDHELLSYDVTT